MREVRIERRRVEGQGYIRNEQVAIVPHDGEIRRSKDAIKFQFGDREEWIPRSQIIEQKRGKVVMLLWMARKKKLAMGVMDVPRY